MANGEFLRGVSEGIFGRLQELNQEQKIRDNESKLQTLNLLAGLADKVEPQSLPTLLQHMGDVMQLKGPVKKFWQAFSGTPNRGLEDQLGTKLRDITSGLIGPETAKQSRESYKQNLLQPYREAGTRPRSVEALPYKTPPSLQGKMVFRDPQEEIEKARQFQEDSLDKRLSQQQWIEEQKERLRSTLEANRERVADEKLLQQQRLSFSKELGDQIKFYRGQGVRDPKQARRLALNDYSDLAERLGIPVPPLIPDDNKMLDKVQSQINRLNQLTLRGGGTSKDNLQTWIELSDGSVVPADKVNFDRMPPGVTVRRMFSTMNGQPITFGRESGGGAFTLDEAKRQIEIMGKAGRSPKEINSAIEEMIKDNPKMADELRKLKPAPASGSFGERINRPEIRDLFADPEGTSFGASGSNGVTPTSQEEIRKRVELDVMKSEVDWLKAQLNYAEKQMQMAPGVVQKEALQRQVTDLKERLTYAEGEFKKKGGGTPTPTPSPTPFSYIQR